MILGTMVPLSGKSWIPAGITMLGVSNPEKLTKSFLDKSIHFGDFIPLILTDNGEEFTDIFSFIWDSDGMMETNLFFCDPYRFSEKPFYATEEKEQ